MNTTQTTATVDAPAVKWSRPVQGKFWSEYRSKCGRFIIRNRGAKDFLLEGTVNGRTICRGFDTLWEAKVEAEIEASR